MRRESAPSKSEVFKRSAEFIKYRCGPRWLAPLSGNDYPALEAFCSAAESWCRGDTHNRALAEQAMQALLSILQPHVRHFALMAIVSVSDWEIAGQVIPRLVPADDDLTLQNLRTAFGGEYSQLRIGQVPPTPRHGVPVVLTLLLLGLLASCAGTSVSIVPQSCSWYRNACDSCLQSLPRKRGSGGEQDRGSCPPCGRVDEACKAPPAGLHSWPETTPKNDDEPQPETEAEGTSSSGSVNDSEPQEEVQRE